MRPRASSQDGWPWSAAAVGFDPAAVSGLTAALLLDLGSELVE
jgi:hypothetical protein